tara:strand:- start:1707 stop:1859 length:153 start_codon:yes stop_codon:yes gene_type:complete
MSIMTLGLGQGFAAGDELTLQFTETEQLVEVSTELILAEITNDTITLELE